jgi:serine protease Do
MDNFDPNKKNTASDSTLVQPEPVQPAAADIPQAAQSEPLQREPTRIPLRNPYQAPPRTPYDTNPYGGSYGYYRDPYAEPARVRRRMRPGLTAFLIVLSIIILLFLGGVAVYGLIHSDMGAALGIGNPSMTSGGDNPIKPQQTSAVTEAAATTAATSFVPIANAPSIVIVATPTEPPTEPVCDENGMRVLSIQEIARKVKPSVVGVVTTLGSVYSGKSLGSGIIMSEDGFILTNAHVVEGGASYTVTLDDKTAYDATLIGADEKSDIAILKIDAHGLIPATFGDSDSLVVGDLAVAIGNPSSLDLAGTTTAGIISAVDRNIVVDEKGNMLELIQTDAAINPGNSGGPLLNRYGQVIGINTVKLNSQTYEGLCFAIPTNVFKPIVDELLQYGQVRGYPTIGITGKAVEAAQARAYRIPLGVYIVTIDERSDAYAKGLKPGDIITYVNGTMVSSVADINIGKKGMKVGDTLTLTVYRNGETFDVDVVLMDEIDLK